MLLQTKTNNATINTTMTNHVGKVLSNYPNTWGYNSSTTNSTPATTFFTMPDQTSPQVINAKAVPVNNDPTYVTYGAYPTYY
jgi:hypothetical protein